MNEAFPTRQTDDIPHVETSHTDEAGTPVVTLDIYHEEEKTDQTDALVRPFTQESLTFQKKSQKPRTLIALALVFALCSIALACYLFYPFLIQTVTITIIPVSHEITHETTITVVPQQAEGTNQITGRQLSTVTMRQEQVVSTTGKGHQEATQATGSLTFYNAASVIQTVPVGTLITSQSGVEVVTYADAVIPAGSFDRNGQITVQAHAVLPGKTGNLEPGAIAGNCCLMNVLVQNLQAFTGGEDAHDYQAVAEQDITQAVDAMHRELENSTQVALQAELQEQETLIPPSCVPNQNSSHKAGEEAQEIKVVAVLTCTSMAYQTSQIQEHMTEGVNHEAMSQLGNGYVSVSGVQVTITGHKTTEEGTRLEVTGTGIWYYQFSQEQLTNLAQKITGQTAAQAERVLLRTPGVQQVQGLPERIPVDSARVHVVVLYVPIGGQS